MHYWGYGPYYTGFSFGGIFIILWWILVVWLIFALLRFIFGGHRHHHWRDGMNRTPENDTDEALRILKSRYARGEITKKDFDAIKKDIA
jgi:putative membrane protein